MNKQEELTLLSQTLEARKSLLETIENSLIEAKKDLSNRYHKQNDIMSEEFYHKTEAYDEVLGLINSLKQIYFIKGPST